MKANLPCLLFVLFAMSDVQAGNRWTVVDYGTYRTAQDGRTAAPGSSTGDLGVIDALEFPVPVTQSTRVEAALGVEFGFNFVDETLAALDVTPVQIRVTHPPIVSIDGNIVYVDSWETAAQGIPRFTGWKFERQEELAPGQWTISVIHNGAIVLSKSFDVRLSAPTAVQ